mgnify:FL=1
MTFKQAHRGNYSPGRTQPIEYIVVHYTANKGDTAQNNLDYFARTKTGSSAHYFVDENEVCQSVKDTDVAWHCGSNNPRHPYCRNANSIGIEMCNSVGGVPEAVRARTADFVRQKMKEYGLDVNHVLRHYDATGKRCPAPWVDNPAEWMEFKKMLEEDDEEVTQEQFDAMMDNYLARRNAKPPSPWAVPYIQQAIDAGVMTDVGGSIQSPQGFVSREELATVAAALAKK